MTLSVFLCLCLIFTFNNASPMPVGCDKRQCKGPIKFYEELRCKPIYGIEDDCCAIGYDCFHLDKWLPNKCYINGNEYNIGDEMKKEDRPWKCEKSCPCRQITEDHAEFVCSTNPRCSEREPSSRNCFFKTTLDQCCDDEEICHKEDDASCVVNGVLYVEGETFQPFNNPELFCQCMPGYKGENIEPFCTLQPCQTELTYASYIRQKCAPVFFSHQVPSTSCSFNFRCQSSSDAIISSSKTQRDKPKSTEMNDDMVCAYGNMTMHVGDKLSEMSQSPKNRMECVCEVPPFVSCHRIKEKNDTIDPLPTLE